MLACMLSCISVRSVICTYEPVYVFVLHMLCKVYTYLSYTYIHILHIHYIQVDWLASQMQAKDFTVSSMHGEMDQKERDVIMREFISGTCSVYRVCIGYSVRV